jgi:hypothetical protein
VNARAGRGFSLAEVLVVLALLFMILWSAWPLWDQAQRILQQTSVALRHPDFGPAAARLRNDVQGASGLGTAASDWSDQPLVLRMAEGRTVRLGVRDGSLERQEVAATGGVLASRVVFPVVSSWRWRAPAPRLVDIEITHAGISEIRTAAPSSVAKRRPAPQVTEHLRFALRGEGGGRSW